MRLKQIVAHGHDIVDGQLGGGVELFNYISLYGIGGFVKMKFKA